MKNLSVVFFTGSGHTKLIAEAVAEGARAVPGISSHLHQIQSADIQNGRFSNKPLFEALTASDAIIFGTPTYMGGPSAQFKAFADASSGIWFGQGWKDKVAAGFTGSGNPSGDKLLTLEYLSIFAAQHGMHWINNAEFPSHYLGKIDGVNRLGSSLGLMARNETPQGSAPVIDPGDRLTAVAFGRRVATFTLKLRA